MKHLVTALVILALIAAGAVLCIQYTRCVSEELLDTLDFCEDAVMRGDWRAAQENIALTSALWEKHRPRLAAFLLHSDLNRITDLLIETSAQVELKNRAAFLAQNRRLSALVDEISRMDALTFENLF